MTAAGAHQRVLASTLGVALCLVAAGCGSHHGSVVASCPVTKPGGPRPPRVALLNFGDQVGKASDPGWYGNGALWTSLPTEPEALRDGQTGMLRIKLGWFRARAGKVTVMAKPLRGPPARFRASVGTPAEYGPTGFTASGLEFGRPGCWRVDARLAGSELTLVLDVQLSRAHTSGA